MNPDRSIFRRLIPTNRQLFIAIKNIYRAMASKSASYNKLEQSSEPTAPRAVSFSLYPPPSNPLRLARIFYAFQSLGPPCIPHKSTVTRTENGKGGLGSSTLEHHLILNITTTRRRVPVTRVFPKRAPLDRGCCTDPLSCLQPRGTSINCR